MKARDLILREYPDADFDKEQGLMNGGMWRAIEDLMERYYLEKYSEYKEVSVIDKDSMVTIVSSEFGITPAVLKSKSRKLEHTTERHVCMYLMRKHLKLTRSAIGDGFFRDHATVWHACNKVADFIQIDRDYDRRVKSIEHKINAILNEG